MLDRMRIRDTYIYIHWISFKIIVARRDVAKENSLAISLPKLPTEVKILSLPSMVNCKFNIDPIGFSN